MGKRLALICIDVKTEKFSPDKPRDDELRRRLLAVKLVDYRVDRIIPHSPATFAFGQGGPKDTEFRFAFLKQAKAGADDAIRRVVTTVRD